MITKRFRVFAGPNGSGKSSLYDFLVKQKYFTERLDVNADKIAKDLRQKGFSVKDWPISCGIDEFLASASQNTRPDNDVSIEYIQKRMVLEKGLFAWKGKKDYKTINTVAAYLVDYLTAKMLETDGTFFYETVFSHRSKLQLLQEAKDKGFKVYLYFVSTKDPKINWERVQSRVKQGGHGVPREKVFSRYKNSLENLYPALKIADRVYFFDNSESGKTSYLNFAECRDGEISLTDGVDEVPEWFSEYVIKKIK
ncbi:zeta toxin family protein [uncultured Fibrobacter sp.]|uniref:zeta toxin family protein n=1 Tax=uncultured Fibrobacter sp. TaxID=261512 RepID=UPI0025F66B08|nr:zeta toxin family protein [uncultured Fibrobacter sp.]MBR6123952.1 AAA family ATPase [Candidatus Saccharibacteria bacterium]